MSKPAPAIGKTNRVKLSCRPACEIVTAVMGQAAQLATFSQALPSGSEGRAVDQW
jgi:hypothetical protein